MSRPDFLVWTMGKVGSGSIQRSLKKAGFNAGHIHYVDEENVNNINAIYQKSGASQNQQFLDFTSEVRNSLPLWIASGMKIIIGVRDPVSRAMSALFQNYELLRKEKPTEDLSAYFEELNRKSTYNTPLRWFDIEPKSVIGFDVYDSEFNKTLGYQIYQCGLSNILVYRLGLSDLVLEAILSNFCGRKIELVKFNIAENKDYANIYSNLKQSLSIDPVLLQEIYNSQYSQHFWSQSENQSFIDQWTSSDQ